jgi:6-phosphogluconolactonase
MKLIFPGPESVASAAAALIVKKAKQALEKKTRFTLALSGGSTPLALYRLLGAAADMPWPRTHLFWGDERMVPPEHEDSNYGVALAALGSPPQLASENIHRIQGEKPPDQAAGLYREDLRAFFRPDPLPVFDLLLLGLGADGHTASLFPGGPGMDRADPIALAVPAPKGAKPQVPRVTLSLAVINAARAVLFLVTGSDKASILARVLSPKSGSDRALPAALVNPQEEVIWHLDQEAAQNITDGDLS